jgi:hypothetical protein
VASWFTVTVHRLLLPISQTGLGERCDRNNNEDEASFLIEGVLHDQGRNDPDPELRRFQAEVAQRLAELGIETETLVDLSESSKNLRR